MRSSCFLMVEMCLWAKTIAVKRIISFANELFFSFSFFLFFKCYFYFDLFKKIHDNLPVMVNCWDEKSLRQIRVVCSWENWMTGDRWRFASNACVEMFPYFDRADLKCDNALWGKIQLDWKFKKGLKSHVPYREKMKNGIVYWKIIIS